MTATTSPDLVFLRHLASRTDAAATDIGTACSMTPAEVRARLAMLAWLSLVAGRQDLESKAPRRGYVVTSEGRYAAGVRRSPMS